MIRTVRLDADALPFDVREAMRYAGTPPSEELLPALTACRRELVSCASPAVCAETVRVEVGGDEVSLGGFSFKSRALARNLSGCSAALVFAATLGVGVDRLLLAASHTSPFRAVLLQGAAAEMIESLCDEAESRLLGGLRRKPRFSPGYGDLPLEAQRAVFAILSPEKHIGLTLNSSMMLSPAKSVTAVVGICDTEEESYV